MGARLHVGADVSAIGLAYPVLNCEAVTVKADTSGEHAYKCAYQSQFMPIKIVLYGLAYTCGMSK